MPLYLEWAPLAIIGQKPDKPESLEDTDDDDDDDDDAPIKTTVTGARAVVRVVLCRAVCAMLT